MSRPPLCRMVFNSIAYEVLDKYRDGKMSKQEALTKFNELLDYVIDSNNETTNDRRDSEVDQRRSLETL